jgi:hypothetical protein
MKRYEKGGSETKKKVKKIFKKKWKKNLSKKNIKKKKKIVQKNRIRRLHSIVDKSGHSVREPSSFGKGFVFT